MKTFKSYDKFKEAMKNTPELSDKVSQNHLYMKGVIDTPVLSANTDKLPSGLIEASSKIDDMIIKAFSTYSIISFQYIHSFNPAEEPSSTKPIGRYHTIIYGTDESESILRVLLTSSHLVTRILQRPGWPVSAVMGFVTILPTSDNYKEGTKEVVNNLWDLIKRLDYADAPAGYKNNPNFKGGRIALIESGKMITTGHPSIEKLELKLPEKPAPYSGPSGIL